MNCARAPSGIRTPCKDNFPNGYSCSGSIPVCVTAQASANLEAQNMVECMFFNMDLMYAFRDEFLYNSEKGEDYIDNYYFLSEEYQDKIGISLALQTALFFKDFNPVMKAFVKPENHLSEIMFTDDLTRSLLNLLDKYEKITTSEGKAILAYIKTDINSFKGKKLQDVIAMMNK